jgi:hypothetical protein
MVGRMFEAETKQHWKLAIHKGMHLVTPCEDIPVTLIHTASPLLYLLILQKSGNRELAVDSTSDIRYDKSRVTDASAPKHSVPPFANVVCVSSCYNLGPDDESKRHCSRV